jgi:DNA-directed RNA polymerase alpha subunit
MSEILSEVCRKVCENMKHPGHAFSLNLWVRTELALQKIGVTTIGELLACSESRLLRAEIRRIDINHIKACLKNHGLSLQADGPYGG